jgi:hypothetical protein
MSMKKGSKNHKDCKRKGKIYRNMELIFAQLRGEK